MIHVGTAGCADNKIINSIELENSKMRAVLWTLGASLNKLCLKKDGSEINFSVNLDNPQDIYKKGNYYGLTVGPVCNRISGAKLSVGGKEYKLEANENGNCLHGGDCGFSWKNWDFVTGTDKEGQFVEFSIRKPDMDGGFPGTIDIKVKYTLIDTTLRIEYAYTSDKDTYINPTNHTFFNLDGDSTEKIDDYLMKINTGKFAEIDKYLIPTGRLIDVDENLDFCNERKIGSFKFDHLYVFDTKRQFTEKASVYSKKSGVRMKVFSDLPAMQLYTANIDTNGCNSHCAACFETQFPTDPNKNWEDSCFVKKGETYLSKTEYVFMQES